MEFHCPNVLSSTLPSVSVQAKIQVYCSHSQTPSWLPNTAISSSLICALSKPVRYLIANALQDASVSSWFLCGEIRGISCGCFQRGILLRCIWIRRSALRANTTSLNGGTSALATGVVGICRRLLFFGRHVDLNWFNSYDLGMIWLLGLVVVDVCFPC